MSEGKDPEGSSGLYRHAAGQIWCLPGRSPPLHRLPINGISDISPAAVFYRNRVALCRKQFRFATKCEINNRRLGSATTCSLDLCSVKRITSLGTGNKDDLQRSSSTPSHHLRIWISYFIKSVTVNGPVASVGRAGVWDPSSCQKTWFPQIPQYTLRLKKTRHLIVTI